jgi:hypothetical protein
MIRGRAKRDFGDLTKPTASVQPRDILISDLHFGTSRITGFVRADPCPSPDRDLPMLMFTLRDRPSEAFVFETERLASLVTDMERIRRGELPKALASGEDAPILDRWILGHRPVPCLAGLSTGHPRLAGVNRAIATSDLWLMSEDRTWARTLSRWYRLGRPAEQSGPDA